jgi:acetyltransferase-like isoleucine patch superfamily enzyme
MRRIRRAIRRAGRLLSPSPIFATGDVRVGRGCSFGRNVVFNSRRVRIGDHVRIGDGVVVNATDFEIGDHGTIYDSCFFPGPGTLRIGHNFWLGTGGVVDCAGGTTIGSNVGAGAHSQLWSHIRFGDVCYGSRFHGERPLVVEDDVWFVGHCLVSPVHVGARSLAMLGSVVTRDMAPDRCYAGVPAKDVTDRVGPPIAVSSIEERVAYLERRLDEFARLPGGAGVRDRVRVTTSAAAAAEAGDDVTVFDVATRTYTKRGTDLEGRLMRFLLPDAKFVPVGTPSAGPPPAMPDVVEETGVRRLAA